MLRFAPILVPPLLFLLFLLIVALFVFLFVKKSRATVTDGKLGQSVHLDTPFGSVDIRPHQGHDPNLASIPRYPGGMPIEPEPKPSQSAVAAAQSAEYDFAFHIAGRAGRSLNEQVWTPDSISMVIDYYEREFPGWKRDMHLDWAWRFEEGTLACERAITIRNRNNRTEIEYSVLYPEGAIQG